MPTISKLKLPPLNLGKESLGKRLARLRKQKGHTQIELAHKIGITQVLVSDYERGRIRPHYEMVIRLALALEVTTDELLGVKPSKNSTNNPNLKIIQRLKKIEALSPSHQKFILKAIDSHLKALEK